MADPEARSFDHDGVLEAILVASCRRGGSFLLFAAVFSLPLVIAVFPVGLLQATMYEKIVRHAPAGVEPESFPGEAYRPG